MPRATFPQADFRRGKLERSKRFPAPELARPRAWKRVARRVKQQGVAWRPVYQSWRPATSRIQRRKMGLGVSAHGQGRDELFRCKRSSKPVRVVRPRPAAKLDRAVFRQRAAWQSPEALLGSVELAGFVVLEQARQCLYRWVVADANQHHGLFRCPASRSRWLYSARFTSRMPPSMIGTPAVASKIDNNGRRGEDCWIGLGPESRIGWQRISAAHVGRRRICGDR